MDNCPVCHSKKNSQFVVSKDTRNISSNIYKYIECELCGTLRLPIKSNVKYYNHSYGDKYYNRVVSNWIKTFLESIYGKFVNFQKLKLIVNRTGNKKKVRILDVGSGDLSFLKSIQRPDFKKFGVDIYKSLKNDSKIDVINADFLIHDFSGQKFELATSWHVIEHIGKPKVFLRKIHKLLVRDGVAIISTPNLNSFGYKWFRKNWYHLDAPRHLVLFSESSLIELVLKSGFKLVKNANMFYEFPLDLWHSSSNSSLIKRLLLIVCYPVLKILDRETITLVLRK